MTDHADTGDRGVSEQPELLPESPKMAKKRALSKRTKPRHAFRTPDGKPIPGIPKFFADILKLWYDVIEEPVETASGQPLIDTVTVYDPRKPLLDRPLPMGKDSPICQKCGLFEAGCQSPFFKPKGPKDPIVTVIYEGISTAEDKQGVLVEQGANTAILRAITRTAGQTGVRPDEVRWVPLTRCASRQGIPNYRIKGNWCRLFLVQDLLLHRPQMIIPVGTAVLGLLSHKSNAQDWQGRLLTYRGWPDDWLTDPAFVEPRPDPSDETRQITGHPLFGPPPEDVRIPMVPLISTRLAFAARNENVYKKWYDALDDALVMANDGVKPNVYTRPWYRFVNDPEDVRLGLAEILEHPGIVLCYDTETTGLRPLDASARIVSMMFRWTDPKSGNPRSLGFPWNFVSKHYDNRVQPHILELAPLVLQVLTSCRIVCHNATFDMLYSFFNIPNPNIQPYRQAYAELAGVPYDPMAPMSTEEITALRQLPEFNKTWDANICALARVFAWDTWHMAFVLRQARGSLGLELLAYDHAPTLAGYEEEMTLLIQRKETQLHPGSKGADPDDPPHYLNISEDYYPTHVIPYVMGDVEVCYTARESIEKRLAKRPVYRIPLADPVKSGQFRLFTTPSRSWVYEKIMSPSARTLMAMMARGMYVDPEALNRMEAFYPVAVTAKRDELRTVNDAINDWCLTEERANPGTASEPGWELDLENKSHLRHILFDILNLKPQRLTKQGRKLFGETPEEWEAAIQEGRLTQAELRDWAAIDKFTLNKLAVDYPEVRPLQEYRQLYKLYTTYVRPLRNIFSAAVDKHERTSEKHLCVDQCIHASFLVTGTLGGRLSCQRPNLQQLPNRGDVKQLYTSRFRERGCVYTADLSQIELRLMAAVCGDPTMLKAYREKLDLHTLTTSRIFNLPYEHFSKEHFAWLQEHGRASEAKELELKRRIGKCVDPSTLVSLDGRVTRIGDLHPGRDADRFYAFEGHTLQGPDGPVPTRHFYASGVKPRVLVCAQQGLVVSSLAHPFLTASGALVPAGDLRVGDVLAAPVALTAASDAQPPVPVDADKLYLMGLFYGDGGVDGQGAFVRTGNQPAVFEWQDTVMQAVCRAGFTSKVVGARVRVAEAGALHLLEQLGAVVSGQPAQHVPDWLFNADPALRKAFLAGWLDADGPCVRHGCLCGVAPSWQLAQDLTVLMATCGIAFSLEPVWVQRRNQFDFRIHLSVRASWTHFRDLLRRSEKRARLHPPRFEREKPQSNKVLQLIALEPAEVVDVEVATEAHLFVCNSSICRNTANFLTGYGGGAMGLQTVLANNQVYKPLDECEAIIDAFFDSYPALQQFISYYKRFIQDKGCAVSLFGRVRIFEETKSDDAEERGKALRAGCNHIIQSTAADMMLIALNTIETLMRNENLESILVSTVHDSLMIDAVRDELPQIHNIVYPVLNQFHDILPMVLGQDYDTSWMIVPFAGDCEVGQSYYATNKIPETGIDWDRLLADDV